MKIDELMVGDWIADENGMRMQVESIFRDETVYLNFEGNTGDSWEVDSKDLQPIAITPEILERNGFHYISSCEEWVYTDFGTKYTNSEFDSVSFRKIIYNKNHKWSVQLSVYGECGGRLFIDNVHELQHALRLCKLDKEIVL